MLRFSTTKVVLMLAVSAFICLLAVPNLMAPETRNALREAIPGWVPSWLVPTQAVVLGLDLQGGSHVLLEVDFERSGAVAGGDPA